MTGPLHPGRLWMSKSPSDSDIRRCMKQRFSRAQALAMRVPRFATYMADINTTDTAVVFDSCFLTLQRCVSALSYPDTQIPIPSSSTMTYDSDDTMSEKLALAIMAQARASVQPRRKNWGNPAPLFVLPELQTT